MPKEDAMAATATAPHEAAPATAVPPEDGGNGLPGLAVSGVVLSKAQLVLAMQAYVPAVIDIQPLAGGEHFSLLFGPQAGR